MNEENIKKNITKTAEVIGEGTYGCIHKPSLKCKNKKTNYKKKVSKLLLTENAEKEIHEYDILSKIDKKHEYYLGNPIVCSPSETEYNKKSMEKCETFVEENNNNLDDNTLIIMNDGGSNLEIFADKMHKISKSPETTSVIELFWIEFHRILMGIQLFLKNGILHFDMKPQNIVYDELKNRINIIDFGLMRKIEDVVKKSIKSNNYLGVYHWSYPFESNFHNKEKFDDFVKLSSNEKEEYYKKMIDFNKKNENVSAFRNFFSFVIDTDNNDKSLYMKKYMEGFSFFLKNEVKDYNQFLKSSLETVDVYGTGIAIAYVNNMTKHLTEKKFSEDLRDLAFQMTNPILQHRYTIDQAIMRFEEIINNTAKKHKKKFNNNKLITELMKQNETSIVLSKKERKSENVIENSYNECKNTKKCYKKCAPGKIRSKKTRKCIAI
jgi:serine/threonine protein kinase